MQRVSSGGEGDGSLAFGTKCLIINQCIIKTVGGFIWPHKECSDRLKKGLLPSQ